MKIAVPTRDGQIDDHYGHCDHFTVFTIDENKKITAEQTVESPQGCGCKSNIAQELSAQDVTVMLSGNMGQGAVDKLTQAGIQVVRGCAGEIKKCSSFGWMAESKIRALAAANTVTSAGTNTEKAMGIIPSAVRQSLPSLIQKTWQPEFFPEKL